MKTTFDKENWTLTFDTDACRAIRFVNGFNPDMRVKLPVEAKDCIWYWLDRNLIDISTDAALAAPEAEDVENWKKYERMLNRASEMICG